jgi:hypothetical protein
MIKVHLMVSIPKYQILLCVDSVDSCDIDENIAMADDQVKQNRK